MGKFKICPICHMRNKPNMIECLGCETDLTSVQVTDEDMEKEKSQQQIIENSATEEYVRICDCGCVNSAIAKKCKECGEDISDIAPVRNEQNNECKYVMASLDGVYVFELKNGKNIVGRENGMQEYLKDKSYVSRKHARLIMDNGKIYIENLSGTNCTFVNNKKIVEKTELKISDEVGLGGNEIDGKRQDEAAYFTLRKIGCM